MKTQNMTIKNRPRERHAQHSRDSSKIKSKTQHNGKENGMEHNTAVVTHLNKCTGK